ncbi:hypothetical protein [Saccharomonospora xinjiangensis]|uniref:PDGLE domain-containing protein n=1 Tax=Saccharomonospora xinjiangensis XJ-54 TaxID=882086 RepID=I0UZ77_9PSEU|nr:hypothetical protein [Saccharomonospora xinjiangensis]EID53180.1 hypothetical protein SacxiDRAFT_0915 [Saccharomonospora xinjiangensis XJ-54]
MAGALRKAGLVILGVLLTAALAAGGGAAIWFPIESIVNFEPQNITSGHPGNPRIPEDDQFTDLLISSLLMITIGVVLVGCAIAIVVALIRDRLRSGRRY